MSMYSDYVEIEKEDGSIILDVCEGVDILRLDLCDWDDVTEVNIPASVKRIAFQAVVGLNFLERFNVSPENKYFVEVDGCVYSSDMKTLVLYPPAKACDCFEIPSTVERIAPGAFWGVNDLNCVKVGKNVKFIGYEAFAGSCCIERIYIDKGVEEINRLIDDLFESRKWLVIGGPSGSVIEQWCYENAVRFCPLSEDQVEDFLSSSEWNEVVPSVYYFNEYRERMKKGL